jgi:outer membrane receptor protein involved in Fe transport
LKWRYRQRGNLEINRGNGLSFNARANFIGSRFFISDWANKVDKLDGYHSLDAKLSYAWKGLKAFVGVNNLTDQKFSEFAVVNGTGAQLFYPSPGRNFIRGISYTF